MVRSIVMPYLEVAVQASTSLNWPRPRTSTDADNPKPVHRYGSTPRTGTRVLKMERMKFLPTVDFRRTPKGHIPLQWKSLWALRVSWEELLIYHVLLTGPSAEYISGWVRVPSTNIHLIKHECFQLNLLLNPKRWATGEKNKSIPHSASGATITLRQQSECDANKQSSVNAKQTHF